MSSSRDRPRRKATRRENALKRKKDDKIVSKLNAVSMKDETKAKEEHIGNIDEDLATITKPWSEIKNRETFCKQRAAGTGRFALLPARRQQEYITVKPVPVLKYRGYYVVVHHRVIGVRVSRLEVDVTLEEIRV